MTGPLASLAAAQAERLVNALLAADPFAARRLRRFSGRTVAFRTRSPAIRLTVHFGEGAVRLSAADAGAPDAAVAGDARVLARLLLRADGRRALVDPDIAISGDAMLVQDLAVALGSLDMDWQDRLAPLLGDAAAGLVGEAAGAAAEWARHAGANIRRAVDDYLRGEAGCFPHAAELERFGTALDALRLRIDRAQERTRRIADRLDGATD